MKTDTELSELDAWIAGHVMGIEVIEIRLETFYDDVRVKVDSTKPHLALPEYTTDPAAAMQVLEKCVERVPVTVFKGIRDGWQAQSYDETRADWCIEIRKAATLPLAICLFARELFKEDNQ